MSIFTKVICSMKDSVLSKSAVATTGEWKMKLLEGLSARFRVERNWIASFWIKYILARLPVVDSTKKRIPNKQQNVLSTKRQKGAAS
jgi:hypothetical protein